MVKAPDKFSAKLQTDLLRYFHEDINPLINQAIKETPVKVKDERKTKRRKLEKVLRKVRDDFSVRAEKYETYQETFAGRNSFSKTDTDATFMRMKETVSPQTVSLPSARIVLDRFHIVQHMSRAMNRLRIQVMNQFDRKSHEYKALKRYWKLIQQDSRKLSDKRFYRPTFRRHLTNQEVVTKLLSYSQELKNHYELYQLLLFHFQEKQADQFFELIQETLQAVNPIFQTVFKTFLKDKDKIVNALALPYSNAKLEATNNIIKVIKRNAFGFRKMKRQNTYFHCLE